MVTSILFCVAEHPCCLRSCPKSLLFVLLASPASDLGWCYALAALRHITSSGEPLTWDLAEQILHRLPGAQLLNVYGSSEVGADATACDVGVLWKLWKQRQQAAPDAQPASHSRGKGPRASGAACVPVGVPLPGTLGAVVRLQSSSRSSCSSSSGDPFHGKAAQPLTGDSTSIDPAAAAVHDADTGCALLDLADPGEEGEVWVAGPGVAAGRFPCVASHDCNVPLSMVVVLHSPPPPPVTKEIDDKSTVMPAGYLVAAGAGRRPVPAAAAARFVSLPIAAVAPLLLTTGSRALSKHPERSCNGSSSTSASEESSLLLGQGAAAWLQRGCIDQCSSPSSRLPGGSAGSSDGGCVHFFRTGDLGRVDAGSGLLVLGGRRDLQVKIRGVHTMVGKAHHTAISDSDYMKTRQLLHM